MLIDISTHLIRELAPRIRRLELHRFEPRPVHGFYHYSLIYTFALSCFLRIGAQPLKTVRIRKKARHHTKMFRIYRKINSELMASLKSLSLDPCRAKVRTQALAVTFITTVDLAQYLSDLLTFDLPLNFD